MVLLPCAAWKTSLSDHQKLPDCHCLHSGVSAQRNKDSAILTLVFNPSDACPKAETKDHDSRSPFGATG